MKPLSRVELLALPPVIDLPTLGRALGISEPVARERARRDEFEPLGIKVVRLGAQRRVVTASLWAFLGIADGTDGASNEEQSRRGAGQVRTTASVVRLAASDDAGE
jgi:hypothetical protein